PVFWGKAFAADPTHWAFTPPERPPVPTVESTSWVRNPVDAFILARLDENGLKPAPEADQATLVRRLCFDLTGLPPSLELQKTFLADDASDAYERLVDRLLASPQYGERWAQHWLDLARYADTDGFEFDQARPDAWRYRDWVIDALNRDMPYDQFLQWQMAGDEMAPDDPTAFIATGFHRCYPDMVDLNDQGLRRQNALNDITETTGLVFLGLTIGCARCHDHKFDPISQRDFYRLQAFFTPARFRDDYPIASPADRASYKERLQAWERSVADVQAAILRLEAPVRATLAPGDPPGLSDEKADALHKPESERTPAEVRLVFETLAKDRRVKPEALSAALDPAQAEEHHDLLAELRRLKATEPPPLPQARGLEETSAVAAPTFLLRRGDYSARGDEVQPEFPEALTSTGEAAAIEPLPHSTGRRSALAAWLTRANHPLTSRVIVNRLWQHHFGQGIVATPSDFGILGDEPTHPALLDWLACELTTRGWSLKAMHRLMVTSATYRQSSRPDTSALVTDPDNLLLWRHSRQRLDGETLRDALLAVSGRLNPEQGGPPIFPELPEELTKLSNKGAVWPVSNRRLDRDRRSLYVFIRRNLRYPFFEAFDRPDTNVSCPRRPVTTIAPQALTLLNSQLANDSANAFADRIASEAGPNLDSQIKLAYQIAFARQPDSVERQIARTYLENGGTVQHFCLALLNANEFLYVE
ncbi:MAG TPA: DUF1549 and DUF1553 domain-containing protein, partial [Isosphaeraceae bacterium]|nr:DUF1549 and DUF1553 domain-containing protein [Isosphaeraceae bacterium]